MPTTHLVVDGSNIATEGRSLPSLTQLLDAVEAVGKEHPGATVTVIVDATFGHRIDASERGAYEERIDRGELITPPAGVIGRGDAFILEVADRANAVILSNDSFQEFHGTYDWLFKEGRLLGGKFVPGVGWIFLPRSPVRGPTSRKAVSDAKRKRRGTKKAAVKPESTRPSRSTPAKAAKAASRSRTRAKDDSPRDEPAGRKRGGKEPKPYNEPLPFIEFVGAHPVGSVIEAEVAEFASHGAYVICDGTRCYISLKSISDPPPRSAREALDLGETYEFVVQAIDTPRRGIDLAMPGFVAPTDDDEEAAADEPAVAPTDAETEGPAATAVAAPPAVGDGEQKLSVSQRRKLRAQQQQAEADVKASAEEGAREPATATAPRTRARRVSKAAGQKAPTTRKAASQMATKKAASKKQSTAKKAAAKKSTAKKAAAKKSTAKKSTAKKSTAKKAAAKKSTAKKSTAKKSTAKKSTAKRATAKKATARRATAKKATATRAPSKRA